LKNKFKILPILIFLTITILPLVAGLIYALLNSIGLAGILADGFTLENWRIIFGTNDFFQSIAYSVTITLIVLFFAVIFALIFCEFLQTKVGLSKFSLLFYIPLATPLIVAGFLTYQILGQSGLFSRIAYNLHLIKDTSQFPDMVNDAFSIGIVFTHVLISTSFFTIHFTNVFRNENISQLKVLSKTLGAGNGYYRRKIYLPIMLSKATPTIILYGIFILGSYELPMLLGRQEPQMISVAIAQKFQKYNIFDVPIAYCMAFIYTILVSTVLFILYKRKMLNNEVD